MNRVFEFRFPGPPLSGSLSRAWHHARHLPRHKLVFVRRVLAEAARRGAELTIDSGFLGGDTCTMAAWVCDGRGTFGVACPGQDRRDAVYQAARCYDLTKALGLGVPE